MLPDTELVVVAALKFSQDQRIELVDRLLKSLEDEDLEPDPRERLHAMVTRSEANFAVPTISADTVLDRPSRR